MTTRHRGAHIAAAAFALTLLVPWPGLSCAEGAAPPAGSSEWDFQVSLDGKPVGSHRFSVRAAEPGGKAAFSGTVHGVADFTVRLLGVPVYRYHHESDATWRDGCLTRLKADTDDNGSPHHVTAELRAEGVSITGGQDAAPAGSGADPAVQGCVLDYAYWSPTLKDQKRLLDPQAGRLDDVRVTPLGNRDVTVKGAPVPARGWRIQGPEKPIDVWYAESDGRWIGLDAELKGNRKLSYRLP